VPEPTTTTAPRIEIAQPKRFTTGAVLVASAYGLCLAVPVFVSLLVVSVLKFGVLTVLIPLLALAGTALILPLGLGNPYVARLVRALTPAPDKAGEGFIVQLTLWPRVRSGLRAVLDDADDVGYLHFNKAEMTFAGDSVKLSVPYDCIEEVRFQNIGLRGLFVYGRRIGVAVSGLPNFEWLEFTERSSWLLPTSRKITKQLYRQLSRK
jgi:hypothetical protein